jgi:hypothetical protein
LPLLSCMLVFNFCFSYFFYLVIGLRAIKLARKYIKKWTELNWISLKLSFQTVDFKISSFLNFVLKSLNKIFMWHIGNWSTTCCSSKGSVQIWGLVQCFVAYAKMMVAWIVERVAYYVGQQPRRPPSLSTLPWKRYIVHLVKFQFSFKLFWYGEYLMKQIQVIFALCSTIGFQRVSFNVK